LSKAQTISTREFAAIVGFPHGNIRRTVELMIKRGELKLRVSHYQNKPGGKKFDEYHLTPNQANLLNGRLKEKDQQKWVDYVQSQRPEAEAPKPMVVNVSVSHPVSAGVTRIVSPAADELTMSSLEIADLTGKDHRNVLADVRNMLKGLGGDSAEFSAHYKDTRNRSMPCFNLPRREVDILLTGYSVQLRAKVIDRWRELEAEVAKPVPANLNDAAALRGLLLGYTEKVMELEHQVGIQAEKIAEDKPKADYYAHVRDSKNTETIGNFAKVLGFGRNKLFAWLRDQNILMHNNMPQQKHIDQGHFRVLDKDYTSDNGNKVTYKQTVLTGKGKTYVQKRLKKAGNPDLGEDD